MSDQPNIPDGQLDVIFYHGAYPLWVYLHEIFGINIVDVCARVSKTEPILKVSNANLAVRVVELPSPKSVDHTFNNDVIFLLNSVNVVFESLKSGVEKDGVKLLNDFKFELDADNNMFLVRVETGVPVCSRGLAVEKVED